MLQLLKKEGISNILKLQIYIFNVQPLFVLNFQIFLAYYKKYL